MKEREDINVSAGGEKLELPYYNSYPEAEPVFNFETKEERDKKKKRKTAIIVWSIVLGCVLIIASIALVVLDNFLFFPSFTDAAERTVSDMLPDTKFNFAKFEGMGQSTVGYNDGEQYISYWETHKKNDSSMRLTVEDANSKDTYKLIEKDKSFAVMYGENWYGASADALPAASNSNLTDAENAYLLSYLQYVAKSSAKDNDAKITENFVKKVFKSSSVSASENFYGNYEILGTARYVKSRSYTVNNENLAEFFTNLKDSLNAADPTVKEAFKRNVNVNLKKEGMTYDDIIAELDSYVKKIDEAKDFEIKIEICYSGKKISAMLITKAVTYSSGTVDNEKLIIDFFANGAKIHQEEEFVSASEADGKSYVSVKDAQITISSAEGKTTCQLYLEDNGAVKQIKLELNATMGTAELVAALDGKETFKLTGEFFDTKEQFNVKFTNLTKNGEKNSNFTLLFTCHYKSAEIALPIYSDITTMGANDINKVKDNKFTWDLGIDDGDELEKELDEFFGFVEKSEDE